MSDVVHKFQCAYLYLITLNAVAVKIPFNGSTSMAPISLSLKKFDEKNIFHSELFK